MRNVMMLNESVDAIARYVRDFRDRRIIVLGDAILDEYLTGDCSRISPEAPVPVLKVTGTRQVLGGAANTAANIVSLGGRATLIATVGDDDSGQTLVACAANTGVDFRALDNGLPTLRKTRVVGQHQQIVRLDYEHVQVPSGATEDAVLELFEASIGECDVVVISDYAKGFLSESLTRRIIQRAHEATRPVIVDPRPQHRDYYLGCDYVTPNWRESRALLRWPDADPSLDSVDAVARTLATELRTNVVLTLGQHGIS